MKIFSRLILVVGFFQLGYYPAFAQKIHLSKNYHIFSFSTLYSSNLLDMNFRSFENLYLVVCEKPVKIDSVMSVLSKKDYSSMSRILDTLHLYFDVYKIVTDSISNGNNSNKMLGGLIDYNNYKTGYLFSLNDTIKKYSSVVGYVIQRYTSKERIRYKTLNDKCNDFPNECRAIIIRIE